MTTPQQVLNKLNLLSTPRDKSEKRNVSETFEHSIEDAHGNVYSTKKTKRTRRKTEPDFVKFYLTDMSRLKNGHPRVLAALAKRMEYKSNIVCLSDRIRLAIAAECDFVNVRSLKNAITKLLDAGQIKKIGTNEYMVDPRIYAKGPWEDIEHARTVYEELERLEVNTRQVRAHLDTYVEYGEDRKADEETREHFLLHCAIHEGFSRERDDIEFE